MSEAVATPETGNPDVRQIRDFFGFVDSLNGNTTLNRNQIDRLRGDLASFRSLSSRKYTLYELGGTDSSRQRGDAAERRRTVHDEYVRLVSERDERRESAEWAGAWDADASAQRQAADDEVQRARADYARATEKYHETRHLGWSPHTAHLTVSASTLNSLEERVKSAEKRRGQLLERLERTARQVWEIRSEYEALQYQINETLEQLKDCDETVARVGAVTRNAADDKAVAWAVNCFSHNTNSFVRTRYEDGIKIGVAEFMTRLDGPVFTDDDDPEPLTGRTALERLATLIDDDAKDGDDW